MHMKKHTLLLAVLISATSYANQTIESSISVLTKTEVSKQEPKQEPKQEKEKKKPSKKSKKSSSKKSAKPVESEFNSSRSNREKVD